MESVPRPRVYATARRAARRAGTFGRRNLTGRHAYHHRGIESQPALRGSTTSPVSNSDKKIDLSAARRSTSSEGTTLLLSQQSESRGLGEELDVYFKGEREAEAFPELSLAPSSRSTSVVPPTGPNTPYKYSGSPSPTSPPYYPGTPESESRGPQTPQERAVTQSIKPESPAQQTAVQQAPRARERSLTRSIKQEPSEPFCFNSPTTPSSCENTVYNYIRGSIPTKPLPRPPQAGPSIYARLKRSPGDHNHEGISNPERIFWPPTIYEDAGPSTKRHRVDDTDSSPTLLSSLSPPKRLVRPVKRVPLGGLTFAESSSEPESSPSPPGYLLRLGKRAPIERLILAEFLSETEPPPSVRYLARPVNRVLLGELKFEEMPKKTSTTGKRKRVNVISASGEGARQPGPRKMIRRGEQVIEETVRVLVPASSAPAKEGQVEQVDNEEGESAEEEERVVVSQTAGETTRKNVAGLAAGQAATTNPKGKQDTGINVDLGRVNNVLQGTAATTGHQNASPAPSPSPDENEFYDYEAEFNTRNKVSTFLERDVSHLVQKSSSIEDACTTITAMVAQVEDLQNSQNLLDRKFAQVSKAIKTSEISLGLKETLHRDLERELLKVSETIGDSLLRVEAATGKMIKGVARAKKWAKKKSTALVGEEITQPQERRPGPPKGSKPTPFEPQASQEEIARNMKKIEGYYALLKKSIMEREVELGRKAWASQKTELGKRHVLAQRYEQTPQKVEEARVRVKREREEVLLRGHDLESGGEVREGSLEVSSQDEEVADDEEYEDEVNENSPPRVLKRLPAPAPPRRRLGDGLVSAAAPPAKAPAPVCLGSDAPTERVMIPAFGTRRASHAHTTLPRQQSNNDDTWSHAEMEALFDGVRYFWHNGPRKWAQAVKFWDETGGKGKGRAGEGNAGGKRALSRKSVGEIERKGREVAMGFVEANGVGEWMEPWRGIL